jgi:multimeric flavodoxin WrbA
LDRANSIAILGSARKNSNTAKVLERLITGCSCDIIDLQSTAIASYNYEHIYPAHDQFLPTVRRMVQAPVTIIATPVYWYSYSTPMKIFIDRFSDLLGAHKELGRQLRGRRFALISTSAEAQPDPTLGDAFSRFCDYLDILYVSCAHAQDAGEFVDPEPVTKIRNLLKAPD